MANFPQFFEPLLTELTSQPGQGLDVFETSGFLPTVRVSPKAHQGILLVDRNVMTSTESNRDLSRSPEGRHPSIQLGEPNTVEYQTSERASPMDSYAKVKLARAQDPLQFRERKARHLVQVAMQKCYRDVVSLLTTAGNWTNNAAITAIGGSGKVVSDLVDGDILTDIQVAIELYQAANGQMDPAHLVINRKALQYGSRQANTRARLSNDSLRQIGSTAVKDLIESICNIEVHVQTAAQNNALMWGASMILLPSVGQSIMNDNGAQIDPSAAALIHEDFDFAPGDFFVKEWERDDGNVVNMAAVKSYDTVVCDNKAAYLVTGLY